MRTWELLAWHPSNLFSISLLFLALVVLCDLEVVNAMGHYSCTWVLLRNLVGLGSLAMTSKKKFSSLSRCVQETSKVPHFTCLHQDSLLLTNCIKNESCRGKKASFIQLPVFCEYRVPFWS